MSERWWCDTPKHGGEAGKDLVEVWLGRKTECGAQTLGAPMAAGKARRPVCRYKGLTTRQPAHMGSKAGNTAACPLGQLGDPPFSTTASTWHVPPSPCACFSQRNHSQCALEGNKSSPSCGSTFLSRACTLRIPTRPCRAGAGQCALRA